MHATCTEPLLSLFLLALDRWECTGFLGQWAVEEDRVQLAAAQQLQECSKPSIAGSPCKHEGVSTVHVPCKKVLQTKSDVFSRYLGLTC